MDEKLFNSWSCSWTNFWSGKCDKGENVRPWTNLWNKSLGSFYLEDNRNIWRSAGAVSDLGNHMTFEHGTNFRCQWKLSRSIGRSGIFTMMGSHQVGLYINGNPGQQCLG